MLGLCFFTVTPCALTSWGNRAWAEAIVAGRVSAAPSRRLATGAVQIRPDRDGKIVGVDGVEAALRRHGEWIWQKAVPRPGRKTVPIEKGYLANAWFRLRHPDYDELRRRLDEIGRTVKLRAV